MAEIGRWLQGMRQQARVVSDNALIWLWQWTRPVVPGCKSLIVNDERKHSAPFLAKATAYLERHGVPFEHIDVWVPSVAPESEGPMASTRLSYAGRACDSDS